MNIRTGTPGPFQQPSSYGRNESGQFSTVIFEDVDAGKINLLAAAYDAAGVNYAVDHSFGKSKLTVQLSYNYNQAQEAPVDLWEYSGRSTPKDLLQAATNTGITGTLSILNIEVIRKATANDFTDIKNASTDSAGIKSLNGACFTDGNPANALIIYSLMKSGFSDYPIRCPILRHTQTVSAIWPITLSQFNVGKIITTSTLFSLETVPAWAINGLPNIAAPAFSDGKSFVFGWYKDDANINQIAGRKVSIVQEFQYGLWPTAVFGTAI